MNEQEILRSEHIVKCAATEVNEIMLSNIKILLDMRKEAAVNILHAPNRDNKIKDVQNSLFDLIEMHLKQVIGL